MAEREGFEPSVGVNLHTLSRRAPSANSATSPQIYLDPTGYSYLPPWYFTLAFMPRRGTRLAGMAEGVGFEPTELSFNGFQDRRLKPLGHPS